MDTTLTRNYFIIRTNDHVAHSITTSLEEALETAKLLVKHFVDETGWEIVQTSPYPERMIRKHWVVNADYTMTEVEDSPLIGTQLLA